MKGKELSSQCAVFRLSRSLRTSSLGSILTMYIWWSGQLCAQQVGIFRDWGLWLKSQILVFELSEVTFLPDSLHRAQCRARLCPSLYLLYCMGGCVVCLLWGHPPRTRQGKGRETGVPTAAACRSTCSLWWCTCHSMVSSGLPSPEELTVGRKEGEAWGMTKMLREGYTGWASWEFNLFRGPEVMNGCELGLWHHKLTDSDQLKRESLRLIPV